MGADPLFASSPSGDGALGALVQFAAAAVGDAIVIAGNLGELALLAGLVISDWRLSTAALVRDRA